MVQELLSDPLLVNGRKADVRCHLLIDCKRREASSWVPPIILQIAGCPYVRGTLDPENANPWYQRRRGYQPEVMPLPDASLLSARLRDDIQGAVRLLSEQLIDTYLAMAPSIADDRDIPRRVFLWGFDAALATPHGELRAYLLDNTTRPQLYWDQPACDQEMATLIGHHLDAMLRRRRS